MMLVANFKSHKNVQDVLSWITNLGESLKNPGQEEIVACPTYVSLYPASEMLKQRNWQSIIKLGAQNVSEFGMGAFTGEVQAESLTDIVNYIIIGHSERRRIFGETGHNVQKKVEQAIDNGLKPIICVAEETIGELSAYISQDVVIAYEPPAAIGSGTPASTDQIVTAVERIQDIIGTEKTILYGGSVALDYIEELAQVNGLNGFLIGGASLDSQKFLDIIYAVRNHRSKG